MNKYPYWLNILVLVIAVTGIFLALPNIYGSSPAVQLADKNGVPVSEQTLSEFVRVVENTGVQTEGAYLHDGRAVLRFSNANDQGAAGNVLRGSYARLYSIAPTLAPRLPDWVRGLGLNPMSLGLDLRGGVYVLLEVDMDTAVETRLSLYQQDFEDRLSDARIRRRVDLSGGVITVRLTSEEDTNAARDIIRRADPDLIVRDGADGRSILVRMTDLQIKARQDLAIEQNTTTLRNRVDELGVAEPLVQRQGVDRIVVQLPGVQDPGKIKDILTATATLEFRLVDQSGDEPGSRRYPGRGNEPAAILKAQL